MTLLRALCLLLLLAVPLGAQPRETGGTGEVQALLDALARSETPAEAQGYVPQIWSLWLTAPDAAAQEVLDAALERQRARDLLGALRHLDRLVAGYPGYAEGWNQRATVHFLAGNYDRSLADVAETLAREPRHFGALSGRATIYWRQGRLALAQLAVREALKVHPFLAERAILDLPAGKEL
jgi:tetratricopeptide (TPR) repeat protein